MNPKYRMIGLRYREPAARYSTPNKVAQNLRFEIRNTSPQRHAVNAFALGAVVLSWLALGAAMVHFA